MTLKRLSTVPDGYTYNISYRSQGLLKSAPQFAGLIFFGEIRREEGHWEEMGLRRVA